MMDWPRRSLSFCTSGRAITSVPPPAAHGINQRIGFVGYGAGCANAVDTRSIPSTTTPLICLHMRLPPPCLALQRESMRIREKAAALSLQARTPESHQRSQSMETRVGSGRHTYEVHDDWMR